MEVYQELLNKMLEVQKNMRHDLMNDVQVIHGYLQLNHPEKALNYSQRTVKRLQRYQRLGKIPLPLLQCFLTWYVSQLENDEDVFMLDLPKNMNGAWQAWQDEDGALTQLLMEILCPVQDALVNRTIKCRLSILSEAPTFSLLFEGDKECLTGLIHAHYGTETLYCSHEELSSGLLMMIKRSGHARS
ncbi:MAG TPA: Spo0B domain-containing protein [Peptococcaceae bacterium]|nr:Spo0B domain-containing protein [Peptococcaceae bacterium]